MSRHASSNLSLFLTHILSLAPSSLYHSHTHYNSQHTHSLSLFIHLSRTHTHSQTYTLSLFIHLSRTHIHTHTHTHTHTHKYRQIQTHKHPLSHTHTHTYFVDSSSSLFFFALFRHAFFHSLFFPMNVKQRFLYLSRSPIISNLFCRRGSSLI